MILAGKHIYVILGMARGGTSTIARSLEALGVDLGNNLTPANDWNPKGFWEDREIVYQINEKILKSLNYKWDSIFYLQNLPQIPQVDIHKAFAKQLLQKRFSRTAHWGFKDPRTVKVLDFWQIVFSELDLTENYIIALRDPWAAAISFQKLSGADIEHGLLLWATHLFYAVEKTANKNRIIVSYELMLEHPREQLLRLRQFFNLFFAENEKKIHEYANTFLDKKLNHHISTSFSEKIAILPFCLRMHACLEKIARDQLAFSDNEFINEWQAIKDEFKLFQALINYTDTLLSRNYKLNKYVKVLHKSRLWRFMYPLRKIDEALRLSRKMKT